MTTSKLNLDKARQAMEVLTSRLAVARRLDKREAKKLNRKKRKVLRYIMEDWGSRLYLPGGKRAD